MKNFQKITLWGTIFLLGFIVFPPSGMTAGKYVHKNYHQRLVKSRANRGYTNHGTEVYNYHEIDSYDDSIDGEELGNVEVDRHSHVRKINNVVIVKGDVKSDKDNLEIGKVKVKRTGHATVINNSVTIDGKIDVSGESMEIGNVKINRGGTIEQVDNKVEIQGDINAH